MPQHGWTPLHYAAHKGRDACLELLLQRGASSTVRITQARRAAALRCPVRSLLWRLADAPFAAQTGWTPLHWAARKGHAECAALLVEHGADPTAKASNVRPHDARA